MILHALPDNYPHPTLIHDPAYPIRKARLSTEIMVAAFRQHKTNKNINSSEILTIWKNKRLTTNIYPQKDRQQKQELFWNTTCIKLCLCRLGIFSLWTFRRCWIKLSGRLNPILPFLLHVGYGQSSLCFSKSTGIRFADSFTPWMLVGKLSMNREELFDLWTLRRCLWQLFFVENLLPHSWHSNRDGNALEGEVSLTLFSILTPWIWKVKFIPVCFLCWAVSM